MTGRNEIEIAGAKRMLACDMNCADVLFQAFGEHWTLWLIRHFIGFPVTLEGGRKGRQLEAMTPAETMTVLHALLATEREDLRERGASVDAIGSEKTLRRAIRPGDLADVQAAITRAVVASFGIPGEAIEVVAGADGEPRGSRRAGTHGTGTSR